MPKTKKITLDDFRSSTFAFRHEEEAALKVKVIATDKPTCIFEKKHITETSDQLSKLKLPEYDEAKILSYVPSKEDELEKFVDDLLFFICDLAELDDGLKLTLRPCNLKLEIEDYTFAAIADREGRRGQELTWIIQEDKHRKSSTYKHGDLQLACAMIAANQQNYNLL